MQLRKYVMAMECDANKSPNCWFGAKSKFWGKSWSEVDQKARAEGWVLHHDGRATCPKCNNHQQLS